MKKIILFISCIVIQLTANAQYINLLNFVGATNGNGPVGSLISDGTFFYGLTQSGGTNNVGTLFKIMPDGSGYVKLLDFAGVTNGSYPLGSLFYDGTFLYGTTEIGGANNLGTLFRIMPDGTGYLKLLDFTGAGNGSSPNGTLISDGTFLYGMTYQGGTNGMGVIFKIMPDGTGFVKLLDFAGVANGRNPAGSLIYDGSFLYGMTEIGGANNMGTVFKIMTDGTGYVNLLDFAGATNGRTPLGSLIYDGTFLYGMTNYGGTNDLGVVFKIMPNGSGYSKLLDFAGATNGRSPYGSLMTDGIFLYGMTEFGGANDMGVVFKMLPDGTGYSDLLDFAGVSNGKWPIGSLFSDGTFLYGTTHYGGTNNFGTIFSYQYCTPVIFTQSPTICNGQSITVGSHTYTTGNTYTDTLSSAVSGCDSIVTTNLIVTTVDTSVSISGSTLTANATNATYQWLDCGNGNSPIAGQTNQNYTPVVSGSYAVIVNQNSCSDTSLCFNITVTGINEKENQSQIFISPNPSTGKFTVIADETKSSRYTIEIYNLLGEVIFQSEITNPHPEIDISSQINGIYFVNIRTEKESYTKKVIISH